MHTTSVAIGWSRFLRIGAGSPLTEPTGCDHGDRPHAKPAHGHLLLLLLLNGYIIQKE